MFSKIFEFIVHNHLSNFFKHKLNPARHGFRKFNSTKPSWSPTLILLCPVCTQGQIDSVYFDFSSAFDVVPHNILLISLVILDSSSYVDWFHSYLDNRRSSVSIFGTLSFFSC
jgi:hypothetical protein